VAGIDLWHYKTIVAGITELIDFMKWLIEEKKYELYPIRSPIIDMDLEDLDILFILSPGYKIEDDEIKYIVDWVNDGGALIVSRPASKVDNINPLLEKFGARFNGKEAESWAFYADVPENVLEIDEKYKKLKSILSEHPINKGLKAIAEGSPKEKYRPYLIELIDNNWEIIGATTYKGEPWPTAVIKDVENGIVIILGLLYLFYRWKFWIDNKELEKQKDVYITNYTYIERILKYIEKVKNKDE